MSDDQKHIPTETEIHASIPMSQIRPTQITRLFQKKILNILSRDFHFFDSFLLSYATHTTDTHTHIY